MIHGWVFSFRYVRYACVMYVTGMYRQNICQATYVLYSCACSDTYAEQWLIVFRCLRGGVIICGPRERRNVHNDISGTFQMAL